MKEVLYYRQLLQETDDLRFENPREAVRRAEAVRERVAALDQETIGEADWLTLQAEAWGVTASALRTVSELGEAENAINVALAFLEAESWLGAADPAEYARLAQRASYLRRDQGRFDEALGLIDEAITIYRREDRPESWAGALADRGLILGRTGRQQEAVRYFGEALDRLDPDTSPRNFLSAIYNTACYLHEVDEDSPEVDELLVKWLVRACFCRHLLPTESFSLLKLDTLRALACFRLGRAESVLNELWRTQEGFERLGAVYEQSLTLLHLAKAYLSSGRVSEVKRVAAQLFPVFRGLRTDREASAALMLFYNAAQTETATVDLVAQVSATLREAQARNLARRDED